MKKGKATKKRNIKEITFTIPAYEVIEQILQFPSEAIDELFSELSVDLSVSPEGNVEIWFEDKRRSECSMIDIIKNTPGFISEKDDAKKIIEEYELSKKDITAWEKALEQMKKGVVEIENQITILRKEIK
jgi:hypothetical protein